MKKAAVSSLLFLLFTVFNLTLSNLSLCAQETSKSTALPGNINNIVTVSCVPCHTSTGGLLSRTKLNFTEWSDYSPEKQKGKASKMYSEVKKGAMPPKSARETRPEIIPTREQLDIIKNWVDSLETVTK